VSADAWLAHALCTDPADRPVAEAAIAAVYAQLNRPPPEFVRVPSPAAALPHLPPPGGPWPFASRIASLVSDLRARLPRVPGRDPLRRTVKESIVAPVGAAAADRLGLFWRGQHDVDWVRHVWEPSPWVTLARTCGWWWPAEDRCVVVDRPAVLRVEPGVDDDWRLHSADGPSVVYRDGWAVHAWHGTRVPAWVFDSPTVDRINAESNVEVRRCAVERIGWDTFIAEAGLRLVGCSPDPGNPGAELRLYDLPWTATRVLLAVNGSVERDGTRRRYGLRVPDWLEDPLEAAGWTYGLTGAQYALVQRRT
jgi:hypothetical protein